MERRLITSALIPSCSSSAAASRATPTIRENTVMVQSVPSFTTAALSSGRVKSGLIAASETSNCSPYIISFSRNTTGLSSRIADCHAAGRQLHSGGMGGQAGERAP